MAENLIESIKEAEKQSAAIVNRARDAAAEELRTIKETYRQQREELTEKYRQQISHIPEDTAPAIEDYKNQKETEHRTNLKRLEETAILRRDKIISFIIENLAGMG